MANKEAGGQAEEFKPNATDSGHLWCKFMRLAGIRTRSLIGEDTEAGGLIGGTCSQEDHEAEASFLEAVRHQEGAGRIYA
jgi:hypothetical protein